MPFLCVLGAGRPSANICTNLDTRTDLDRLFNGRGKKVDEDYESGYLLMSPQYNKKYITAEKTNRRVNIANLTYN